MNLAYILGQKKNHIQVDVFSKWTYCVWWVQWSWGCDIKVSAQVFILLYVYLFCNENIAYLFSMIFQPAG